MLVDKLRMPVTTKKDAEIVEGCNNTGQLDAVDQENGQRDLLFANGIEKQILQVLRTFRHGADSFFLARMGDREINNQ